MTTRETVAQKLDYLTPELLAEVDDFRFCAPQTRHRVRAVGRACR